ncbi:MAG: NusG domain II-containing protein [Lachnospiraceae bacterium]|nr:NusG domain II-containing protein [Lachnospiraceae bacterium]
MNKPLRFTFKKGDLIAILLVIILAVTTAVMFLPQGSSSEESVVQIWQDGKLIRELPLTANETIRVAGSYENTVEIRDGRVAITASDCPGSDCVHSGWIDREGRSIVCLPNRVEIRITGTGDVDFVVR